MTQASEISLSVLTCAVIEARGGGTLVHFYTFCVVAVGGVASITCALELAVDGGVARTLAGACSRERK